MLKFNKSLQLNSIYMMWGQRANPTTLFFFFWPSNELERVLTQDTNSLIEIELYFSQMCRRSWFVRALKRLNRLRQQQNKRLFVSIQIEYWRLKRNFSQKITFVCCLVLKINGSLAIKLLSLNNLAKKYLLTFVKSHRNRICWILYDFKNSI
jgi:hypothetical protein